MSRRKTWRNVRETALKDLPIQFRRAENGVYESVAALSVAPAKTEIADGEYRIHRTEHSGRGSTHSGRVRWHVKYTPANRTIASPYSAQYSFSLADAIHMLHQQIARGLIRGFEVLRDINVKAERDIANEKRIRDERAALEAKVRRGLDAYLALPPESLDVLRDNLTKCIADSLQAP